MVVLSQVLGLALSASLPGTKYSICYQEILSTVINFYLVPLFHNSSADHLYISEANTVHSEMRQLRRLETKGRVVCWWFWSLVLQAGPESRDKDKVRARCVRKKRPAIGRQRVVEAVARPDAHRITHDALIDMGNVASADTGTLGVRMQVEGRQIRHQNRNPTSTAISAENTGKMAKVGRHGEG